jgi:hypothetical protein
MNILNSISPILQYALMLGCIAVVVCFFIRQYNRGTDIQDKDGRIQKLHTFYVSGILVFIIIELVTGLCMGNAYHSDILSYVNFAATLSSLIMSVVAIIFTIVTSNRGDEQYKKIDNASDKVVDSLGRFAIKTEDIDKSVEEFKTIAKDLSLQMEGLCKEMGGTHNDVSEVKRMLTEQQSHAEAVAPKVDEKKDLDRRTFVDSFLSISSFSGDVALYACVLAKDNSKTFSLKQISKGDDVLYKYGFLIAALASNLIQGTVTPDYCNIMGYSQELKDGLVAVIDNCISRQTDDKIKQDFINEKTKTEAIFALKPE